MKLLTHLNFPGSCSQAFGYYEEHLGGRIVTMMRQPSRSETAIEAPVLHARVDIGGNTLIGNDVPAERFEPIRSVYLHLEVGTVEEAERVYEVLAKGGQTYMPLQETFFASRFSQLRDQFGVLWTLMSPPVPPRNE